MKVKVARFRIPVVCIAALRRKLEELLHEAGYEKFSGPMLWRFNDGFSDNTKVCIVAYNTGSIVVSGHGEKFDLTQGMIKSYSVVKAKQ